MTYQIHKGHTHCKTLKRAVFLLAVMTSVNALAATPVATTDEATVVGNSGGQVTVNQAPTDPYEAIKWRNCSVKNPVAHNPVHNTSRFRTASNITRADTQKVFKQDYERLLVPVGSAKNTQMIWLAD
ncbi:hypothetical protein ACFL00_04880 [Pseudomonadota bacterium]